MSAIAPAARINAPYTSASLYVGDLHPEVTENDLNETFSTAGSISSIRLCRDSVSRKSLCYAYVNYNQSEDATRALDTLNFKEIKGKACRVCWSQRDPSARRSGLGNTFIKNLTKNIDNKTLYDKFSVFGNIISSKVCCDPTGKPVGHAFVHFETEEASQKAIEKAKNGGFVIDGSAVIVETYKNIKERGTLNNSFTNVYVKNIPVEWTKAELESYFAKFGEVTSSYVAFDDEKKIGKGFGFINFKTHDEAQEAISKASNATVGEGEAAKKLFACRAMRKAERERQKTMMFEQKRMERQQKWASCNLYIKFLPDGVSDEKLREIFSKFGTITSLKLNKSQEGVNTGVAYVCFSTPEEASKAIQEMNTQQLDGGKPLYVALHQPKTYREQVQRDRRMRYPNFGYGMAMGNKMGFQLVPGMMPRPHRGGPRMHNGYRNRVPGQQHPGQRRGPHPHHGGQRRGPAQHPVAPSLSNLSGFPIEIQKQFLGENLYPKVHALCADRAPKITGMFLEMDTAEVLQLLENDAELKAKIDEANHVLDEAESAQ